MSEENDERQDQPTRSAGPSERGAYRPAVAVQGGPSRRRAASAGDEPEGRDESDERGGDESTDPGDESPERGGERDDERSERGGESDEPRSRGEEPRSRGEAEEPGGEAEPHGEAEPRGEAPTGRGSDRERGEHGRSESGRQRGGAGTNRQDRDVERPRRWYGFEHLPARHGREERPRR